MYKISHLLRIRLLTMTKISGHHCRLAFNQNEAKLINELNVWFKHIQDNMIYECVGYKAVSGPYLGIFPTSIIVDDSNSKVVVDFSIDLITNNNSYKDWFS